MNPEMTAQLNLHEFVIGFQENHWIIAVKCTLNYPNWDRWRSKTITM